MAHEIFGERFLDRKAAWHNIGLQNVKEELCAVDALKRIDGDFNVTLEPLYYKIGMKEALSGFYQIMRSPTNDDREFVPLGEPVKKNYRPFTPRQLCGVWDVALNDATVETMGVLRRGAIFFITTKLPTIGIMGDEVERYLGVTSPLDGAAALSAEEWPLRVVCANTLRAAQAGALGAYRVVHTEDALNYIGGWIKEVYERAKANADKLKNVFEKLAKRQVSNPVANKSFKTVYPDPAPPSQTAPSEVMIKREANHTAECRRISRFRDEAFALFDGKGRGMTSRAANHTAWGWVNAVTELEDFRKSNFIGGKKGEAERAGESALFGARAAVKERAFAIALDMAK
jgi:phage/plasmid-like protein (TIGR03299 family)